jgi:hypothetical protein
MRTITHRVTTRQAHTRLQHQFALLVNHVQRLQDAHSILVRRLPQLTREHEELQTQYDTLHADYLALQHKTRRPRKTGGRIKEHAE